MTPAEVTSDALLGGTVALRQPKLGYRVNVDALLVAAFAVHGRSARLAVDLGAGVGAIGLVLARLGAAKRVVLVENDPALVALARDNLVQNEVLGSVEAHDLERPTLPGQLVQRADLVVCNPPYYAATAGTPSTRARAARTGELEPFLRAARQALAGPRARAVFCYPAAALAELITSAADARLIPKRLRLVHPRTDEPARLVVVEFRLAKPGGLVIEPPLVEWQSDRARTPELARIVRGDFGAGV